MSTKQQEGPSIVIAGGGFAAVSILATQIEEISALFNGATNNDTPPVKITIVNPKAQIGPGGPYDHETEIYRLNQPAYAMSPLAHDPEHFTRWLLKRNQNLPQRDLENSFQSRSTYGQYLSALFEELTARVQQESLPVVIETIQASVDDAAFAEDQYIATLSNGIELSSDCLIVADGHHKNNFLGALRGSAHYHEEPLTTAEIKTIPDKNNAVLIVGSGQTMVDRISELQEAGYEGDIHIVSRKGVMPWKLDPELYRDDTKLEPYTLTHFTPTNISRQNYDDCIELWYKEIDHAVENGYGPAHVLGAFIEFEDEFNAKVRHNEWSKVINFIQAYYGNPTPPTRHAMLQDLIDSGRIIQHVSPMSAGMVLPTDTGFEVNLSDGGLNVDAIFNSAGCARTLVDPNTYKVRSPLIAKLDEKGLIEWSRVSGILAGGEHELGLFTASPYEYDGKWGVETFREGHAEVAKNSLVRAQESFQYA